MLAPVNLRFAELIQEVGLTKNAFAQSLGKTASVVQHLIDGRNKPGYDLLCKVFEIYPNVSKDWLMEGQGPMLLAEGPQAAPAAAAPAPPAPAVALKKAAGPPSLFAAQATEDAPEAPVPTAGPAVPPVAPLVAAAAPPLAVPPAVAPAPIAAPPVGPPAAAAAAAAPAPDVAIGAALQTQHLLHQLALAELRNQHLLEQQQLLRQMLDMAQGR
ncbi:XRE family transcriptional regulator [Hymenobacter nivis]|uniref:XRE family transcriptional regulator n=2 Tax=Hymenobacter nivis TaxID=1850093 RepID=A0A502GR44_9BACT|nr:XRE family transcriptional regulator [Hymenobacter nivis]